MAAKRGTLEVDTDKVVEAILAGAEKASVVTVNGIEYTTERVHLPDLPDVPKPAHRTVHTLQGVLDYLKHLAPGDLPDEKNVTDLVVHVVNPTTVQVVGPLEFTKRDCFRPVYCQADAAGITRFGFNQVHDLETFRVALLTQFAVTPDRETLIQIFANVRDVASRVSEDNGITETVVVESGPKMGGSVEIPLPAMLAPFRTFPEIEQPVSPFIARYKQGGGGSLHPAGDDWTVRAIRGIADWLKGHGPENLAVIA